MEDCCAGVRSSPPPGKGMMKGMSSAGKWDSYCSLSQLSVE